MFISSISNKMSLSLDYQCQNLIRDIESKVVCLATTVKKMEAMEPNNPNLRLINSNLLEIEFYKKTVGQYFMSKQMFVLIEDLLIITSKNQNFISVLNLLLNSPVSYVIGIDHFSI